ncbi:hypothetical protein ACHWQZ_G010996 [Mnemiopsis leidyi]
MAGSIPTVSFLAAWTKFRTNPSDDIIVELSRSINEILAVFDAKVDYSPLYEPLSELITDNSLSSLLLSQAISLLNQLVEEMERRQDLAPYILPALSYQVLHRYRQLPSDSLIKLCLESLRSCVQDVKITFVSQNINQLTHLLVKLVLRKDARLLDDALAVLASICRNNLLVQGIVKSMENIRSLYSRLMTLLGDDSISVIVHSLALITALCLNEDLGNKLFVGNVDGTYTLVINMLNSEDQDTKLYCLNLLIDFTRSETMLSAFVNCQGDILADLTQNHLIEGTQCIKNKVCELLLHLATKSTDLYTRILRNFTNDISRCLIEQLRNHNNQTALLRLLHVLLPDLCEDSHDNRDLLISNLKYNLEKIPLHWRSKQGYTTVTLSCQCLRVMNQDSLSQPAISASLSALPQAINSWLDSAPHPYDKNSAPLFGTESCRAVLEMLTLSVEVGLKKYESVLTHPNLPTFIGKALLSDDPSLITMALKVNSLCFEQSGSFAPSVGNIMAHHSSVLLSCNDSTTQELLEMKRKYSELQQSSCRLEEERCSSPPIALNSQVTELIAQMRDGLQIKDVKSSQLIEIFQEKIAIMSTKEEQLNDLVEAKSMALQQSDRLFTQFRQRVAQAEAECAKYRAMLQETEQEAETRREEFCSVLSEKNDLLAEVESLKGELSESTKYREKYSACSEELNSLKETYTKAATMNSDLSDKLEGLKEEVEMLRVHNDTLKSQHESDIAQVQVLQKDKQKVVTKLEEKDSLYLKTKQSLRQSEEKNRKKDKEKIELESQLSKARSELSKTDSKYQELLEKEKIQECKIQEKDKFIEAQKSEIASQKEEIEKYSKLMAMFHNLSSGKATAR